MDFSLDGLETFDVDEVYSVPLRHAPETHIPREVTNRAPLKHSSCLAEREEAPLSFEPEYSFQYQSSRGVDGPAMEEEEDFGAFMERISKLRAEALARKATIEERRSEVALLEAKKASLLEDLSRAQSALAADTIESDYSRVHVERGWSEALLLAKSAVEALRRSATLAAPGPPAAAPSQQFPSSATLPLHSISLVEFLQRYCVSKVGRIQECLTRAVLPALVAHDEFRESVIASADRAVLCRANSAATKSLLVFYLEALHNVAPFSHQQQRGGCELRSFCSQQFDRDRSFCQISDSTVREPLDDPSSPAQSLGWEGILPHSQTSPDLLVAILEAVVVAASSPKATTNPP